MKWTIRFAWIGCGVIAPVHTRSIAELPDAQLVAVCDIDETRAQKLAATFPAAIYTHYAEMLQRDDIDVVNILTPSGRHADIGILTCANTLWGQWLRSPLIVQRGRTRVSRSKIRRWRH
jgi:UDP-N-acetyl-2-amino-2-deoxyglucuronate dehydrogenase